ncbi:MAG: NYN domain-containing protein [Pseudomonadota bacterium]
MKKVSVFIDGYNLYHAINNLKKPHLKWVNLFNLAKQFARPDHGFEIIQIKFFTAPPLHKSIEVQKRYTAYIKALKHCGVAIIEGKFKQKLLTYKDGDGKSFTRISHEEKESDVNIALAILEDAFEKTSDKILVITNDSDISPAIRLARKKNQNLRINVITPPLIKTKRANYDLVDACGDINKDRKGQVYFKTRMITEFHLEESLLPEEIMVNDKTKIVIPDQYKKPHDK